MKTDTEIRRDVETELQWDPSVDDKKIGVIVSDGIVTLTGEVSHFAEKWPPKRSPNEYAACGLSPMRFR
jgi:osmotically-inducible protein OsmY